MTDDYALVWTTFDKETVGVLIFDNKKEADATRKVLKNQGIVDAVIYKKIREAL